MFFDKVKNLEKKKKKKKGNIENMEFRNHGLFFITTAKKD